MYTDWVPVQYSHPLFLSTQLALPPFPPPPRLPLRRPVHPIARSCGPIGYLNYQEKALKTNHNSSPQNLPTYDASQSNRSLPWSGYLFRLYPADNEIQQWKTSLGNPPPPPARMYCKSIYNTASKASFRVKNK